MTPAQIETAFKRLKKREPEPTTELRYDSAFELLIAVILSAQATDVSVNLATEKLYAVANTPESIHALGLAKLKSYIKTIGLFNTKAENVLKTCRILIDEHDSQVPENREALEALPGVGRKTANVILNTFFGHKTIAVDTHIFRVSNRTGMAPGKNVVEVEKALLNTVPEKYKQHAHHWLILLGRYTCLARKPACENCLINDLCDSAFEVEIPTSVKKKTLAKKSAAKVRRKKAYASKKKPRRQRKSTT
ncbi:MAG: endonuclease III [Acidiferrobacterales bacterium]|nr:endonuclease III [Acidiferrobacterales bacterium]